MASDTQRAQAQLALVQAQRAVDSTRTTLDAMLANNRGASSDAIENARAQYILAENNLDQAQTVYNFFKDRPEDDSKRAQAFTALYNAQQALKAAAEHSELFPARAIRA